jgi:hypothetical protein
MASVAITPMESNFLVPNATFFVELAAFALLMFLLTKYVIPPINRAMTARQEAIRAEFAQLDEAKSEAQGRLQTIFFLTVGLVEAMFFINLAFMALFVFVLG